VLLVKFFIDTANLQEIEEVAAWGAVSGVTTNPTLLARESGDLRETVRAICALIPGPVSVEAVSTEAGEIVAEARELVKLAPNIVVKVPVNGEGLKAIKILAAEGIPTNATLVFSVNQALLAARAGATYVSPFIGRLDDIGHDGIALVRDICEVFAFHQLPTQVIAASIRHPQHVTQAAKAGAHIATVPYAVLQKMLQHPLTDAGIKRFLADWQQVQARVGRNPLAEVE